MSRSHLPHAGCLQVSIDIIKYEDLVWGRFLGRGAEGPVHACMYLDTPVAVKQTSSSTELEMNLSTGGPSGWVAAMGGECGSLHGGTCKWKLQGLCHRWGWTSAEGGGQGPCCMDSWHP